MESLKEKVMSVFKSIKDSDLNCLLMLFSLLVVLGVIVCFKEYATSNNVGNKITTERASVDYSSIFYEQNQKHASKDTYEGALQEGKVISMNFNYSFGESEHFKIDSVYDDSERTYISLQYHYLPNYRLPILPSIYIKEVEKNEFMPVNYKIFNNIETFKTIYLIDKLADEIELRYSDSESIKIKRNDYNVPAALNVKGE